MKSNIQGKSKISNQKSQIQNFFAESEADTVRLGRALAAVLTPGTVVALVGNLGAGKTRLVQAIAAGMGVDERTVNSPTFVLIQEYEGRLPLYHFDTYRLRDTDDFLELGAEELLAADGVCLIEWADRVDEVLPADLLRIEIEITGETARLFRLTATGKKTAELIADLRSKLT